MTEPLRPPSPRPCASCPYRRDVPSGVWSEDEYAKLPPYDRPTAEQPMAVFMCHQQDGRVCAGWCGTHDMDESFSLRLAACGDVPPEVFDAIRDYETDVPLFESGAAAAEHGRSRLEDPGEEAEAVIARLARKRRSA